MKSSVRLDAVNASAVGKNFSGPAIVGLNSNGCGGYRSAAHIRDAAY